jgi:hypothetical protein
LPYAFELFPEFTAPPETAKFAKVAGYPEWAKLWPKGVQVSLDQGFSAINFLLELREVLDLFKNHTRKGVRNRFKQLTAQDANWKNRTNAACSAWLEHNFGTLPLISDLQKIVKIFANWKQRADKFLDEQGKTKLFRKSPKSFTVRRYGPVTREFPVFTAYNSYLTYTREVKIACNACIAYSYTTTQCKSFLSRLFQLMESFGIRLDVNIPWNAIRYTWLLDYGVNVSEWLDDNVPKVGLVDVDVRVLDFCHSMKVVDKRTLTWTRGMQPYEGDPPRTDLLMSSDTTYYRRVRDSLPNISVDRSYLKDWTLHHVINATAFVLQKATTDSSRAISKKIVDESVWLREKAMKAAAAVTKKQIPETRERRRHKRGKRK